MEENIKGKKFNKLTAICYDHSEGKTIFWKFLCECGKEKIIDKYQVTSGNVC